MRSVNPSIKLSCSLFRETTQVWLLQLCLPSLTRSGGSKQFGALTFHTLVEKPWSILNNLTGRSRHSPRHCPVSVDALASQLVRNGRYEAVDRKSYRLVSQKVSDLWGATTPSICPELIIYAGAVYYNIIHAGAALKSWLHEFLSSCLRQLKIPKIWKRALVVAIPKPMKPVGTQRVTDRYICSVSPTRSSRGLSTPALKH